MEQLLDQRGADIEFAVLFGSMARGDWSRGSDYDVLIGLHGDDGKRLLDRIGEFDALVEGNIEIFPYSRSEWEAMFKARSALLLEALHHGVPLYDRGTFGEMRAAFARWQQDGQVVRSDQGWLIRPEVLPE